MTSVPTWEIILIIVILTISAVLINMLAARVYKGGVLMYGKFSIKNGMKQAFYYFQKKITHNKTGSGSAPGFVRAVCAPFMNIFSPSAAIVLDCSVES